MKQSSIDWLIDQLEKWELYSKISFQCLKEIEQAKAMHKEEIENAFSSGEHQLGFEQEAEQYYNETFKAKEK